MKICHLSRLHSIGGVQRSLASFIEASTGNSEISQELITGSKIHRFIKNQISSTGIPVHYYARIHGLPAPKYPLIVRRWRLENLLKKIKPDALVLWDYSLDHHAVSAGHKAGARVIYFEHGAAWNRRDNDKRRIVFEMMDGVLCNSQASKRVLELNWECRKPMRVCRNGLRIEMQPDSIQSKKLPSNRPIHIGIAGRMVIGKAFALAIRSCSLLQKRGYNILLHIAGDGDYRQRLMNLANDLGVLGHCRFLGDVPDMKKFFNSIEILLVPSINESFGLVSIEAQAWGCIPIVAGVDGLPETIVNGKTGFVIKPTLPLSYFSEFKDLLVEADRIYYDPEDDLLKPVCAVDPEDIFKVVKTLIENPSVFESMSRSASSTSLAQFSFDASTNNIIKGIISLMQ